MGRKSYDLGLTLEDTVELWLSRRGLAYERRKRVETPLGFPIEIDFLVHDERGKIVVEVKNLERPVDRDVIIKTWNNAIAVGAYKAIVISSSGFTEPAVRIAKSLEKVELLTLEEIAKEIEMGSQRALYASPRLGREEVIEWAMKKLPEKVLFFIKKEEIREVETVYVPLYLVRAEMPLGGDKFTEIRILISGLTCLPLASRKGELAEVLGELVGISRDVVELYRKYRGSSVSRQEFVGLHGESAWQRFSRQLSQIGLLTKLSERPAVYKVRDVIPRAEELKAAAEAITLSRAGAEGFRPLDYACTPGSSAMMLESLLAARAREIVPVLAPAYSFKLEDRSGAFRRVIVSAWTPAPMRIVTRLLQ